MKPAWVPLAEITLTSTDSEITFGSIPNTYRDLILVSEAKGTTSSYAAIYFNSDTGSNYSVVRMEGNGSTAASLTSTISAFITFDTTNPGASITQIMDYSATDKHKTFLIRNQKANDAVFARAARWANTTAINNIKLTVNSGSFAIGSTFALYGSNKL